MSTFSYIYGSICCAPGGEVEIVARISSRDPKVTLSHYIQVVLPIVTSYCKHRLSETAMPRPYLCVDIGVITH